MEGFAAHRRQNSACMQCFDMVELALGMDLPHEVYASPEFMVPYMAAVDLVWLGNVSVSYSYLPTIH